MQLTREDFKKYFQVNKNGSVIFIGDECKVTICAKYENFGAFNIDNGINTLALFNLNIGGKDYGYILPAVVKMYPSGFEESKENGEDVYVLTFNKNDIFFNTITVVQRTDLVFGIFKIFVFFGFRYKFMNENNISRIFDAFYLTGFNMEYTYSSVISAMFSELYRNPENLQELNRLTTQNVAGKAIGLKNVSLTASSLTAKLSGSFLKENITSSVIQTHTKQSEIEDLLRR